MGQVLNAASRLRKLRAMSIEEIAHRGRYALYLAVERRRVGRGAPDPDRLRLAVDTAFRDPWPDALLASRTSRRDRFFHGLEAPEEMRRVLHAHYAGEVRTAIDEAEAALRHEFRFFGRTFTCGREIDWHADPLTGRRWPASFHADVPVHGGDVGFGDVKYVWELNRHQFLIDLGKAWFLTGERRYLDEILAVVRSWMRANPPGVGVNWACALEPAFRVLSWLWAYHFALAGGVLDRADHVRWLTGFHDHGAFLYRHLERYSSPYNHLAAEAAALYALGLTFPEFREAAAWRRRGRGVLESRAEAQFHPDGGSVEQSTFYHHATLGAYLIAAILGRAHGDRLDATVWTSIERAIEFSMWLVQPDGRVPALGGADDGKPIRMEHLPLWDFRFYQALGAVLFGRGDFRHAAGRFHEDALWLLGPEGRLRFEQIDGAPPDSPSRALEHSGYYVLRSEWSSRADYLLLDCGEQADGVRTDGIPTAAHGHADCLSVILWLGGRPVLVDPGFYCYNLDPAWEVFFRKTEAHSTARVDGRDQARHIGKMAWSDGFTPRLEGHGIAAREWWASGSHDGYARGADGVRHRRTAWLRPDRAVVLYDEFTGTGEHLVELNFQFAPGALSLDGTRARFDETVEVGWVASADEVQAEITPGGAGDGPDSGWIATSLGVRRPAPRLKLTMAMTRGRLACLTVVADLAVGLRPRIHAMRSAGNDARALVLGVANQHGTEWIVGGTRTGVEAGPFSTDATLAAFRETEAGLSCVWIQGSYARADEAWVRDRRALASAAGPTVRED